MVITNIVWCRGSPWRLSDCVCGGRLWAPFLCCRCGRCARCAFPFRVLVLDSASHASRLCGLRPRTRTHSHIRTRTRARRHSWPSRHGTSASLVVNDSKAILNCIISRKQKACSYTSSTTGAAYAASGAWRA